MNQIRTRRQVPWLLRYWVIFPATCLVLAGLMAGAGFSFAVGASIGGVGCTFLALPSLLRVGYLLRIGKQQWEANVERRLG